jgi:hypothetical protein
MLAWSLPPAPYYWMQTMLRAGRQRHGDRHHRICVFSVQKSGDGLNCCRSAVRNWIRRQGAKNLRTATDTVFLRFSLVSTNQP